MRDQLVGTDQAGVARAAAEIREASIEHNVFRGKVLSFGQEVFGHGQTLLQFHRRPELGADQLVLAPATLAEIKRQVVDVARHKARLLARGTAPQARGAAVRSARASARPTPTGTW
ncbi:hypothetical protein [Blastococcus sp. SYSU DS0541]